MWSDGESASTSQTHQLRVNRGHVVNHGDVVDLPAEIREAMVNHARFWAPEESCGLIAGDDAGLRMVYCLTNVERSRVRFTVAPSEHFHAMLHAERSGWSIVGSFHSHPAGPAIPSATDVDAALDPEWMYLIVGLSGATPEVRGYQIRAGVTSELDLLVNPRRP